MVVRPPLLLARCSLVVALVCTACDSVPLLAPTGSAVTVFVADQTVPNQGSTQVTASVIEAAGTPVHDGTVVNFTATLGTVSPSEVATARGIATATFTAGADSGTAEVRAFSGGAIAEPVSISVGSTLVTTIILTADPATLPPSGGTADIVAVVQDADRNPVPHALVTFSSDAGTVSTGTAETDLAGLARVQVTTTMTATVTASAGAVTGTTTITVTSAPAITIAVSPTAPVVGQRVTFTVTIADGSTQTASAAITFGDGQSQTIGTETSTADHTYQQTGTVTVTATATDTDGVETQSSIGLQIQPAAAIGVTISASASSTTVNQPVTFTVTVTPPPNAATVAAVTLDFGDDTSQALGALTGSTTVAHVYAVAGSVIVTATVTDTAGQSSTASTGLIVAPPTAVSVTVTVLPNPARVGETVVFTITMIPSGSAVITAAAINFGDGSSGSLIATSGTTTITHAYGATGTFVVRVTATDSVGGTGEASAAVTVQQP